MPLNEIFTAYPLLLLKFDGRLTCKPELSWVNVQVSPTNEANIPVGVER
jgi:hypothetical protein